MSKQRSVSPYALEQAKRANALSINHRTPAPIVPAGKSVLNRTMNYHNGIEHAIEMAGSNGMGKKKNLPNLDILPSAYKGTERDRM